MNINIFTSNDPTNRYDYLGLLTILLANGSARNVHWLDMDQWMTAFSELAQEIDNRDMKDKDGNPCVLNIMKDIGIEDFIKFQDYDYGVLWLKATTEGWPYIDGAIGGAHPNYLSPPIINILEDARPKKQLYLSGSMSRRWILQIPGMARWARGQAEGASFVFTSGNWIGDVLKDMINHYQCCYYKTCANGMLEAYIFSTEFTHGTIRSVDIKQRVKPGFTVSDNKCSKCPYEND